MPLLEIENLSVTFQTAGGQFTAVDRVSLNIEPGEVVSIVGESGSGKSVSMLALMGLLPWTATITADTLRFEGQDLKTISKKQLRQIIGSKMAMIFQAAMNALNPVQRVGNQIAEAILVHDPSIEKEEAMGQVEDLFELVGIPRDRLRDYPHQYSGGMKQRAVIAMALACHPKLIIADEPTTALDVIVQAQILGEIKDLQKEFDLSIIFISHDISIVADMCKDIGVMYAGQLVEFGPREEVFESPAHPYTKALLSSFPTVTGEKSALIPIPGETPNLVVPPAGCRFCDRCSGPGSSCKTETPDWVEIGPGHKTLCCRC